MGTPRAIERRARASSAAERGRASAKRAASRACSRAIWAVSGLRIERVGMGLEARRRSGIYPALSHRQASFNSAAVFPTVARQACSLPGGIETAMRVV